MTRKRGITFGKDRMASAEFVKLFPTGQWTFTLVAGAPTALHEADLSAPADLLAVHAPEAGEHLEAVRAICQARAPHLPLAAVAPRSRGGVEALRQARALGFDYMITTPVAQTYLDDMIEDLDRRARGERAGLHALVVDDSRLFRDMATVHLRAFGCRVTAVATMEEGLGHVAFDRFDVVVTDIFMPGMGGIEGIRRLRASAPEIGIVAISGGVGDQMSFDDALLAAHKIGADYCVPKPFEQSQLRYAVKVATQRHQRRAQAS